MTSIVNDCCSCLMLKAGERATKYRIVFRWKKKPLKTVEYIEPLQSNERALDVEIKGDANRVALNCRLFHRAFGNLLKATSVRYANPKSTNFWCPSQWSASDVFGPPVSKRRQPIRSNPSYIVSFERFYACWLFPKATAKNTPRIGAFPLWKRFA